MTHILRHPRRVALLAALTLYASFTAAAQTTPAAAAPRDTLGVMRPTPQRVVPRDPFPSTKRCG
jgi:hypothetical protein